MCKSNVLHNLIDNLSIEWIKENKDTIPDINTIPTHIWKQIHLNEFEQLNNDELLMAIKILHKYAINEHYHEAMSEYIVRILLLEIEPNIEQLNDDIIIDILDIDDEYNGILCFLFGYPTVLSINDFIFSVKLLDIGLYKGYDGIINIFRAVNAGKEILEYLKLTSYFKDIKNCICYAAACSGALDALIWAHDNGLEMDAVNLYYAARYDNGNILKWAYTAGYQMDTIVCAEVALNGNLELLKWLISVVEFPLDVNICRMAARGGHLDVLKWAKENSCPLDLSVCYEAVKNGNLEILEWIKNEGCPWLDDVTLENVLMAKHIHFL